MNNQHTMKVQAWENFKQETKKKLNGADGGLTDFTGTWLLMCSDGKRYYIMIADGKVI